MAADQNSEFILGLLLLAGYALLIGETIYRNMKAKKARKNENDRSN